MPPVGSLELVVLGADGEVDEVEGTVSLRFDRPPYPGARVASYEARIRSGRALFERFVVGSRPFKALITLPGEGASWTIEDVGPGRAEEARRIFAPRTESKAITARLVAPSGQPYAHLTAAFAYGSAFTAGRSISYMVRASTDADGNVRFELPTDREVLPPLAISVSAVAEGKLVDGAAMLERTVDELLASPHLGEVQIALNRGVVIRGVVLDELGEPIPEVSVTVHRPGLRGQLCDTDAAGAFSLKARIGADATMEFRPQYADCLPRTIDLDPAAVGEPLVVHLSRGGTFLADIDTSGVALPEGALHLRLVDENGRYHSGHALSVQGGVDERDRVRFQVSALPSGSYRAELILMGGVVPVFSLDGVEISATGESRDIRMSGLRLSEWVREVGIDVVGPESSHCTGVQVSARSGLESGSIYRADAWGQRDAVCLVPTGLRACVSFKGSSSAAVYFDDASALGESVELSFPAPLVHTVVLEGDVDERQTYFLLGIEGTPTQGLSCDIQEPLAVGVTEVRVRFPMAGSYQLKRALKPTSARADGLIRPTTANVMVTAEEASRLRIDAPLRED